jgi:HEPN domain-containing protein
MADKNSHARGWFLKAESELSAARHVLDSEGPYDTACFHTQQTVEKCLKGFLALGDQIIPHTHNLEELARLCADMDEAPDLSAVDVTELTPFAVELRYDFEFWPSHDTAQEAFALALAVRQAVLAAVPPQTRP